MFAALVLVSARRRGLRALAGLGASLAVVVLFLVPAIVEGSEPVAVAVVGSLAIMLVPVSVGHGVGPKGLAAMLGTAAALVLTLGSLILRRISRRSPASRPRRSRSCARPQGRTRRSAGCSWRGSWSPP